ncbi:XK-related protein 8 [Hippoglossus stenolepis]|uniref:XK-related protein 8 n=1 Tax=Hippoglossus stenolepis TaxID=195615 RepID=UPI00159C667E|nr:XK-related protein 8 [Hippoglossus stenolepis]
MTLLSDQPFTQINDTQAVFKYKPVDFLFTCLGLVFLVLDIVLDILAVVSFYQEEEYVSLGVLLLFLLGSSVLGQLYSWLWYSYGDFSRDTKVERCLSLWQLHLLHVLQLGIYFRHAGVVEVSVHSFVTKTQDPENVAVFLSHDLSMLRLFEAFSESSPQLVLMLTIILQRGQLDPVTVLKAIGSAAAIAISVTMYHRSLRSFLPDKMDQRLISSVVYFIWNLLCIASRVVALALFASVLPCFIFSHFFCSWLVLFFFVWRSKTSFMDTPGAEWLYRATVGLIWYFNWFNVAEGSTRTRMLLYHGYKVADISLLCGLWCWKITTEPSHGGITLSYALITAVSVVSVYGLGLLFTIIYYKRYHPNLDREQMTGVTAGMTQNGDEAAVGESPSGDEVDFMLKDTVSGASYDDIPQNLTLKGLLVTDVTDRSAPSPPPPRSVGRCNNRMRKMAENFYS